MPHFIKSTLPAFKDIHCQDPLCDIEGGRTLAEPYYWNTSRRARIKRICDRCYSVRKFKQATQFAQCQEDLRKMDLENNHA